MTLAPSPVRGHTLPRIYTPPLVTGPAGPCGCGCALTPATSDGFDVDDFARDVIGQPLDPWQRWLAIHAMELYPDGRPRFRQVLALVARQNGKTEFCKVLSLFWLYIERVKLVLGTSTNLDYARESWEKAVSTAETVDALAAGMAGPPRRANGEQTLTVEGGGRYKIAASNRKGGRSLTVDRLIMDELREHQTWEAYSAATKATNARRYAQIWMISNQGDEKSVVLNQLRAQALEGLDERLGIFEWSSLEGMAADDPEALAMANPNLGDRIDIDALMGDAIRAKAAGGAQLATFLTEVHCRFVPLLDPAIDMAAWVECAGANSLDAMRDRVALCVDVSLDELHATVYAAASDAEKTYIDAVAEWTGQTAVTEMSAALPALVARVRPKVLGWFPYGPAATAAAALEERKGSWPPPGTKLEPIRGDITAVCMGFAEQVRAHAIVHGGDPVLDAHVRQAEKLYQGDGWRFTRRGAGQVDAAYAAAGAVHLARLLPLQLAPRARVMKW